MATDFPRRPRSGGVHTRRQSKRVLRSVALRWRGVSVALVRPAADSKGKRGKPHQGSGSDLAVSNRHLRFRLAGGQRRRTASARILI